MCLFSPSIYLFNHSCVSVWTHGYLLYSLGYNSVYFISLNKFFSIGPYVLLTYSCHFGVLFCFQHFLSFSTRCSRVIIFSFLVPDLGSVISVSFFYWKIVYKPRSSPWYAHCFQALSAESREICMYTIPCRYTYQ